MARKKLDIAGFSDKTFQKKNKIKGSRTGRKNVLGKTATIVVLGGTILVSGPGLRSDYELSFISVQKKPRQQRIERQYEISSRIAKAHAYSRIDHQKLLRPECKEVCLNSLLLDLGALDHTLVLTDCGYCQCESCLCPQCSSCQCYNVCPVCAVCNACSCPSPNDCMSCDCFSSCGSCDCM